MDDQTYVYVLDLPPEGLNPNKVKYQNRMKTYRLTRAYKRHAYIRAICSKRPASPLKMFYVTARFYHAQRRGRDRDNLNGSLKAAIDGLMLARVGVNDTGMIPMPPEQHIDKKTPRVEIVVTTFNPIERKMQESCKQKA